MSRFSDLLNRPLPSRIEGYYGDDYMEESFDDETINDGSSQECGSNCAPGMEDCCKEDDDYDDDVLGGFRGMDVEDDDNLSDIIDDVDGDDDIDGLSDEDLAALDRELSDDVLSGFDDDREDSVSLTPDEEMKADDDMALAATTLLVKDELNANEREEFARNEGSIAVNESFMTSSDVISLFDSDLVTESKYTNKMRIQLSKEAKIKQLRALGVLIAARRKGDPDFVKYKKVMRVKKVLRAKMERKYGAAADKMAKIYFKRLSNSRSNALAKIGAKMSK